jgi:hypothetical protein
MGTTAKYEIVTCQSAVPMRLVQCGWSNAAGPMRLVQCGWSNAAGPMRLHLYRMF